MNKILLFAFTLFIQLLMTPFTSQSNIAHALQDDLTVSQQPVFFRFQAQEDGSMLFWQPIPRNFSDHVATINTYPLAVLVSSNAQNINLLKDDTENLWLSINYTFKEGDYISTLTWASAKTVSHNLTIPKPIPFPDNYPGDVKPFLNSGKKIPADNTTIMQLAETYKNNTDMVETIENILYFVNASQTYNSEKVKQLFFNGTVITTDILDVINDPLTSLETGQSFCYERALLAVALLRAAGIPARTFTNADLKCWIQTWLPEIGWVDGEVVPTKNQLQVFPRPLSSTIPLMVENSSDASFFFSWMPSYSMRIASMLFLNPEAFSINEYRTILCQPVDVNTYETNVEKYSFPIIFEPNLVNAALTSNGSKLVFHLCTEEKNASKTIALDGKNSLEFEGLSVSFEATQQDEFIILSDFSVQTLPVFDFIVLASAIIAIPIILTSILYWQKKKGKLVTTK